MRAIIWALMFWAGAVWVQRAGAQTSEDDDCSRWRYAAMDVTGNPMPGLDMVLERFTPALAVRTPGFPREVEGPDPVWIRDGQWVASLTMGDLVLGHFSHYSPDVNYRLDITVWFDEEGVRRTEAGFDMLFLSPRGAAWLQDDWVALSRDPHAPPPDEVILSYDRYRYLSRPIILRWLDTLPRTEAKTRADRLDELLRKSSGTWAIYGCAD